MKDSAKKLGISTEKTYFNVIDDQRLFNVFNSPQATSYNKLREVPMKKTASWRYFVKFFEEDQKQDFSP